MNPLLAAMWALPLVGVVFLLALIASRGGRTTDHVLAFYTSITGLVAIPVWLASFAALVAQLLWATFASPAGVLFMASSIVLCVALAYSIVLLVRLRRAR